MAVNASCFKRSTSAIAFAFSSADKFGFALILAIFSAAAASTAAFASFTSFFPNGFTALIAASPFACVSFTASCVVAFWIASTASIAAFATSALAAAFSSSDKLVFLSISANLASAAV